MVRALGINLKTAATLRFWVRYLPGRHGGHHHRAHLGPPAARRRGCRDPGLLDHRSRGVGSFWGAVIAGVLVGLAVALTAVYVSEWSLLSMYLLLIAVVTFRARGLFGKKSILEV